MCLEVTYGVSRIAHVVCFCCVRCSLFQAVNHSVVPLFFLVDLVSVTVPGGWLPLTELPWMPVCHAQGLWLKAPCSPWNHRPLWQAPSPSSSIGDESNLGLNILIKVEIILT